MEIIIPVRPFPAVRENRNSWSKKVKNYHSQKAKVQDLVKDKETIINALNTGCYHIQFHFKMAESWSKKKKAEMIHTPHTQRPDIDNCFKGFTDAIFYKRESDDSTIHILSASKHWSNEDKIVIFID